MRGRGVDAIVMALREAVGVNGTLGAPTFWTVDPNAAEDDSLFDAVQGKSQLGIISERIRQLPGAMRSLHPTHSATFVGPGARDLTAEHHRDETPVGLHSTLPKIGVPWRQNSPSWGFLGIPHELSHHRGRDYTPFHCSSTSLGGNASVSLLPNEMNLHCTRACIARRPPGCASASRWSPIS
jgi:hypothetical protein